MYCCRHRNVTMCEYRNPILAMNMNERNLNHLENLALSFQIAVRSQTTSFSLALSCLILQSDGWIFCGVYYTRLEAYSLVHEEELYFLQTVC